MSDYRLDQWLLRELTSHGSGREVLSVDVDIIVPRVLPNVFDELSVRVHTILRRAVSRGRQGHDNGAGLVGWRFVDMCSRGGRNVRDGEFKAHLALTLVVRFQAIVTALQTEANAGAI